MFNVAVVVGSLRKGSINRKLALALERLAEGKLAFSFVDIGDLPLFNQDIEAEPGPAVGRFKEEIKAADAVLFVTPEYNRSVPGVLKNAIDWGTRPRGSNSFGNKPGAIVGTSGGAIGTAVAQQHLRSIMLILNMHLLGQPTVYLQFREGLIDEQGVVTDEKTRAFLQNFIDRFTAWIERLAPA